MTTTPPDDWSPADNPYAIAVSEAQWSLCTVELSILRMREGEERWTHPFSSEQIDARQLIVALRQLLAAERLEQLALKALGIDPTVRQALAAARQRFLDALPGIKDMRDALTHFEDWSRGVGYGPQKERRDAGEELRDIARMFSGFGYDPTAGTITLGPYKIDVETARDAAHELRNAISAAAHEVDKKNAADLRGKAVRALTDAGVEGEAADALLPLHHGFDLRLRLPQDTDASDDGRAELARQVTSALAGAGICVTSSSQPQAQDVAERLAAGESLYVRVGA